MWTFTRVPLLVAGKVHHHPTADETRWGLDAPAKTPSNSRALRGRRSGDVPSRNRVRVNFRGATDATNPPAAMPVPRRKARPTPVGHRRPLRRVREWRAHRAAVFKSRPDTTATNKGRSVGHASVSGRARALVSD